MSLSVGVAEIDLTKLVDHSWSKRILAGDVVPTEVFTSTGIAVDGIWGGFDLEFAEPHLKYKGLIDGLMFRMAKVELLQFSEAVKEAPPEADSDETAEALETYVGMYMNDLEEVLSRINEDGKIFLICISSD